MKSIEEQLWEFIDGTCGEAEKLSTEQLLQSDPAVKQFYEKLLSVDHHLRSMELEEPSMRFTQNVMDSIALQPAPHALQTHVDKRVIAGIGAFFMITLGALLFYIISSMNWSAAPQLSFSLPSVKLPNVNSLGQFSSALLQG